MSGLIISGGRVVDPASGMDAIGDVAVVDGKISAVGTGLGGAERVIDATGLVVAPGFIDLHAHGQSIPADRMQAFDGVTTTLDLEAGDYVLLCNIVEEEEDGEVESHFAEGMHTTFTVE